MAKQGRGRSQSGDMEASYSLLDNVDGNNINKEVQFGQHYAAASADKRTMSLTMKRPVISETEDVDVEYYESEYRRRRTKSLSDIGPILQPWEFIHLSTPAAANVVTGIPTEDDLLIFAETTDGSVGVQKAGTFKTVANSVKSFVGSGILGLPYAFKEGGLLIPMATMMVVSFLGWHCIMMIIECRRELASQRVASYSGIGRAALGITGVVVVNFCMLLNSIGACTSYLIFIGSNLQNSLGWLSVSNWIFASLVLILPLCMLRSLRRLAVFSLASEVLLVFVLIVLFYFYGKRISDNASSSEGGVMGDVDLWVKYSTFPTFYGIACFAFEGIPLSIPIEMSMRNKEDYGKIIAFSMALVTVAYVLVGAGGYMAYGNSMVHDVITQEVNNPKSVLVDVIQVLYSAIMVGTYPMMMYPANQILEEIVYGHKVKTNMDRVVCSVIRIFPVGLTVGLAIAVPSFGRFMAISGTLVCGLLMFILPAMFHIIIMRSKVSPVVIAKDVVILVFGAVSGFGCFVWVLLFP